MIPTGDFSRLILPAMTAKASNTFSPRRQQQDVCLLQSKIPAEAQVNP
jgi:hypothetical protein